MNHTTFFALTILIVSSMFWSQAVYAVDCSSDDIRLSSQAEVDNFQTDFGPGCDRVVGTLEIDGTDIVNIGALSDLTSIGGNLRIQGNTLLEDIDGLQNLASIDGALRIDGNPLIENIDGLSALTSLGADCGSSLCPSLTVRDNAALENISALSNLDAIVGDVDIHDNPSLTTLDGLMNVTSIGGFLGISENTSLTNLDGLSSLTSVGDSPIGSFWIIDNDSLQNVDGLSNLESVASLEIDNNASLMNLDGLSGLTESGQWTYVFNNGALENVDGLAGLLEAEDLRIEGNGILGNCQGVLGLVDPIDNGDPGPGDPADGHPDAVNVEFFGNTSGCDSIAQVVGDAPLNEMNPLLNDAWFNQATNGQGIFLNVYPDRGTVFIGMFTYDTERPPSDVTAILGEPGHRWVTAEGDYEENVAILDVELTEGGIFDSESPEPLQTPGYGTFTVEVLGCNSLLLLYDFPDISLSGEIPMTRIALDNVEGCYLLDNGAQIQ